MRGWGLIATVAALAVAAPAAADTTKTLARSGIWEAFGGTSENGTGVCGVAASLGGRYFGLKQFSGVDTFIIQMGTLEWKVTDGEKVPATIRFDDYPVWRASGTAFHFGHGDGGLGFRVRRDLADKFAREFRTSSRLVIQFENDRFPQWILELKDMTQVNDAFQTCMRGLQ